MNFWRRSFVSFFNSTPKRVNILVFARDFGWITTVAFVLDDTPATNFVSIVQRYCLCFEKSVTIKKNIFSNSIASPLHSGFPFSFCCSFRETSSLSPSFTRLVKKRYIEATALHTLLIYWIATLWDFSCPFSWILRKLYLMWGRCNLKLIQYRHNYIERSP